MSIVGDGDDKIIEGEHSDGTAGAGSEGGDNGELSSSGVELAGDDAAAAA